MRADLDQHALPASVAMVVEERLDPGEQVVWCGQPLIPGRQVWLAVMAGSGTIVSVLVVLLFLELVGQQRLAGWEMALLPLSLLIFWAPAWLSWQVHRLVYVITNRRAIIMFAGGSRTREYSFGPDQLQRLRTHPCGPDRGHLLLDGAYRQRDAQDFPVQRSFLSVENFAHVQQLLAALAARR